MSVYVDNMQAGLSRMKMSHMMADTLDELHAMAQKVGLRREWFQGNSDHPHYDLCQSKRRLAISLGAKEITTRQLVDLVRKWHSEKSDGITPNAPDASTAPVI